VKLWGNADLDRKISIKTSWDKKTYKTVSDNTGKWQISVQTPPAGGPYEIRISDGDELVLKNILIGEVWFCSGQSNMEMPMKGFGVQQQVDGAVEVILKAKELTPIRIYSNDYDEKGWTYQHSKKPLEDCKGQWYTNSSENVASASATAYYFAKYLQEALNVPVGIVVASWGGSNIIAWMSEETVKPFGVDLSHLADSVDLSKKSKQRIACLLYNAKIEPLLNYKIKGFLWYQGEDNRNSPDLYEKLFPAMVKDYRTKWGIGDFSFYSVEIAPYNYEDPNKINVAKFREMQLRLTKEIPNSGIALTTDIGDPYSIHPGNKSDVGKRLAYWALAKDYGKKYIGYATPIYRSMEIENKKIIITFENAIKDNGLKPVQKPLSSFEIAGEDKVFYPAQAFIDIKTRKLSVWNDSIQRPIAVRYAFKNYTEASLFDSYGLPVAAFRTDNWEK
jgi:sialate O-acetylesterase